MKILILSFYYYPDLCAGSFRTTAFVKQLRQLTATDDEIDVITTVPNRYATYVAEAPQLESKNGVTIRRIALPPHQSGMFDQAKAFVYFIRNVKGLIKHENYALVFATSSRLMTAALGAWVAWQKDTKLYLDIRDMFVDVMQELLPRRISTVIKPILAWVERRTFSRAQRINLVSEGFFPYVEQRYQNLSLTCFTNGIDPEFISQIRDSELNRSKQIFHKRIRVVYAGNIGEGQGLHLIIPPLAKKMEDKIEIRIIGDGGRKKQIETAITEMNCSNVMLLPPMKRPQLIAEYRDADVLFLHMNDYKAFRKVLPSKIFEYAAMGKPIWAGVFGYSAEFIRAEIINAAIFYPCNVEQAEEALKALQIKIEQRTAFVEKFSRERIMKAMAADLLSIV